MISAAVYSESYQVRTHLKTFFKESRISKIRCCSGFSQLFFDEVISVKTQLAIIDITGMDMDASGFINRIFSFNPELEIIAVHFGLLDISVRSAVASVGVTKIASLSSTYSDIEAISSLITSHFAAFIYALSSREQQVLRMISEGFQSIEIAELLGISITTVTVYRKKIAKKIGSNRIAVQTRVALNLRLSSL